MDVLFVLDEKNYNDDMPVYEKTAVRGVICKGGRYAMQCAASGEYKIPGGTVENGESLIQALSREIMEETGLVVDETSVREIGEITEIREDVYAKGTKYICHSLYFFCDVEDEIHPTAMTEGELSKGYHLVWQTAETIIRTNSLLLNEERRKRDTRFFEWLINNGGNT